MENNIYKPQDDFSELSYPQIEKILKQLYKSFVDFNTDIYEINKILKRLELDKRKSVKSLGVKIQKRLEVRNKEILRVKNMYAFDKSFLKTGFLCGVDEVGRGPLAGPIVAAAVILPLDYSTDKDLLLGINDSKMVQEELRKELSEIIKAKAIAYSIYQIENTTIDSKGIAFCNNEIFREAIADLNQEPLIILSDGYPVKNINIKNEFVIKGDRKSASIACASIIAKVYRDNLMKEYSKIYPQYGFEENAGYGTQKHIDALKNYGPCEIHRKSFLNRILG